MINIIKSIRKDKNLSAVYNVERLEAFESDNFFRITFNFAIQSNMGLDKVVSVCGKILFKFRGSAGYKLIPVIDIINQVDVTIATNDKTSDRMDVEIITDPSPSKDVLNLIGSILKDMWCFDFVRGILQTSEGYEPEREIDLQVISKLWDCEGSVKNLAERCGISSFLMGKILRRNPYHCFLLTNRNNVKRYYVGNINLRRKEK